MKIDIDALEAVAKAATHAMSVRYFAHPSEPRDVAWSPTVDGRDTCVPQSYACCFRIVDAACIAAADPSTVLALIARIRELEAGLRRCAAILEMTDAAPPQAGPLMRADAVTEARALLAKGVTR